MQLKDRLARKTVEHASGCLLWTGAMRGGYGVMNIDGVLKGAHVVAFYLEHEYWPQKDIAHLCNTKACVRASHLQEMSRAANLQHAALTGLLPKGSQRAGAKINEEQAKEIKKLLAEGVPKLEIARRYKVSDGLIYKIAVGKMWKHA